MELTIEEIIDLKNLTSMGIAQLGVKEKEILKRVIALDDKLEQEIIKQGKANNKTK